MTESGTKPKKGSRRTGEKAVGFLDGLFDFLSSLKLAVIVLLGLTASLAAATFIESGYDTATAQYYVYRSWWFALLLGGLGLNIFFVAMSRYPWKSKHLPFLLAHIGIIILLVGAWITQHYGIDGNIRISEGETSAVIGLDSYQLVFGQADASEASINEIEWMPPQEKFKPRTVLDLDQKTPLYVSEMISRSEPVLDFIEVPASKRNALTGLPKPALQFKLQFSAASKIPLGMKTLLGSQSFWLWKQEGGWATVSAGPARFSFLGAKEALLVPVVKGTPHLIFFQDEKGGLRYRFLSSEGQASTGAVPLPTVTPVDPGWKGILFKVERWIPEAVPNTHYVLSKTLYGAMAPPPAIKVSLSQGPEAEEFGNSAWLGVGDQATLLSKTGKAYRVGFFSKRLVAPFSLYLHRFEIQRYEGTVDPSSYASQISVLRGGAKPSPEMEKTWIRMNEPLTEAGLTFYQASYEDAEPRPVTTILSVNRDPGRFMKYLGSLLIVFGSIILFARRSPAVVKFYQGLFGET